MLTGASQKYEPGPSVIASGSVDGAALRKRHVERLTAPLLLTHGANDWRVPVGESRAFAEKARALGKPVTYVEFPGQGHHIEGLALQRKLYQARFDFLMAVARPAPASKPATAAPANKPVTPAPTTPAAPLQR